MHVSAGGPYPNGFGSFFIAGCEEREGIRRTSNRVCWTALLGIVLMEFVLPWLGILFLKGIGFPFGRNLQFDGIPPVLYYLLVGFDYIVGMALPAFLYFSAFRIPLSEGLPFRKTSAADVTLYVAFGCLCCLLANYPANLVLKLFNSCGFSGMPPEMPLNNDPAVLVLYGVSLAVIPPLVEEIMFRGVILQSLRRYGDGFAVLFSAALFGLYHGNLIQMVFAFLSGLALGFVVIRTGSLLPAVLIHFFNNAVSYAVELVQRFYGQSTADYVNSIVTYVILVLGIGSLIVLFMQHKLRGERRSRNVLSFSSRLSAAWGNWGGVCFLAYGIVSSLYWVFYGG